MSEHTTAGARPATSRHPEQSEPVFTPAGIVPGNHSRTHLHASQHVSDSVPNYPKCDPVRQRGTMVEGRGYAMENRDWLDCLTEFSPHHPNTRIGLDPMTIKTAILTLSGHPPRGTGSLVSAKRAAMGDASEWYRDVRNYSDIPAGVCMPCTDDDAGEVRRCAIINCPMWAYRTGKNPHSPRRGKAPAHLREHQFHALASNKGATKRVLLDGEVL